MMMKINFLLLGLFNLKMKQIFSGILLVLFLYGVLAYYPVFLWMQGNVRTEMALQIRTVDENEKYIVFCLSEKEYAALSHANADEITISGNLFDVAKKGTDGKGNVLLYCLSDKNESELFSRLDKQSQKNSDEKNGQNILKILLTEYIPSSEFFAFNFPEKIIHFSKFRIALSCFPADIFIPPPEIV